ncbi:MAG: ribosomal subunit interface protein [Candidatus Spechtbacteria bacterium RIFCSPHIGHO2_02_FULL_43_15b]|uniref:Ribosomal subunit interface protein n=1 Tax=Candidatus Spechtbacteria bacterium RIFCSPHIGHO2_01_FULL_43_30 TaxID=1802158 RepID=A0A1G2H4A7_9BACT|nr:MAG: ribosomal subunit interface protein [Candidatus Spechtbacteria bacterium RIFCSPHIGHO2_01_FULL_43_30]OGZ59011.1 MAG: ribosomal subunit interface protein [Candidatus Spechtbacteria bacterium RIFCSPHIGHO2_02_FULL_43_15b]
MKITIKSTNLKLSGSVFAYIEEKVGSLEKFINVKDLADSGHPSVEAWVEVEKLMGQSKGDVYRAEIQIKLPGSEGMRTESKQWDLHQCIDEAKDEMQRRLKRYKNKQTAKKKKIGRESKEDRYSEAV